MEASTNLKDLSRTVIEAELSSTVGIADKVKQFMIFRLVELSKILLNIL
jgi:hypothetical protein